MLFHCNHNPHTSRYDWRRPRVFSLADVPLLVFSGHCQRLIGAGTVSRLCALLLWCELYDTYERYTTTQRNIKKVKVKPAKALAVRAWRACTVRTG